MIVAAAIGGVAVLTGGGWRRLVNGGAGLFCDCWGGVLAGRWRRLVDGGAVILGAGGGGGDDDGGS